MRRGQNLNRAYVPSLNSRRLYRASAARWNHSVIPEEEPNGPVTQQDMEQVLTLA